MVRNSLAVALVAAGCALFSGVSWAQTSTGAGLGVANATSGSVSGALSGAVNSNVFSSPASTTSRISGRTTVVGVPTAISPGLAAAGIETCLGSVSVGGSFVGGGFSFGSTVKDDDCNRRLYARQMYNMGFKAAAAILQCITPEVNYAMAVAGTPCPNPPNMQPVSVPAAPMFGAAPTSAENPPPGYAVNPDYVRWQQENASRSARRGRGAAQRRVEAAPVPREAYASIRNQPSEVDVRYPIN